MNLKSEISDRVARRFCRLCRCLRPLASRHSRTQADPFLLSLEQVGTSYFTRGSHPPPPPKKRGCTPVSLWIRWLLLCKQSKKKPHTHCFLLHSARNEGRGVHSGLREGDTRRIYERREDGGRLSVLPGADVCYVTGAPEVLSCWLSKVFSHFAIFFYRHLLCNQFDKIKIKEGIVNIFFDCSESVV